MEIRWAELNSTTGRLRLQELEHGNDGSARQSCQSVKMKFSSRFLIFGAGKWKKKKDEGGSR
jgi:hypothetical protein